MTPIDVVLDRLPDARPSGGGYVCRCPAHDDRRPSLSIAEGDNGRALLFCWSGCDTRDVLKAIGLKWSDLGGQRYEDRKAVLQRSKQPVLRRQKVSSRTFSTAAEAIDDLERYYGRRAASWYYEDAAGKIVGVVIRWETPEGKNIRPVSLSDEGRWVQGAIRAPRPLYRLPEIAVSRRIIVVEGEKCADALRAVGYAATTSPGGACACRQADWTPLEGKEVVILPDNDKAGRKYAAEVAAITGGRIVELSGLGDGEDAFDFVVRLPGSNWWKKRTIDKLLGW